MQVRGAVEPSPGADARDSGVGIRGVLRRRSRRRRRRKRWG